ncbi:MAG: C45 family autoproteolytic acyltransferase/hydrolase [Chloroflexi bacterium]|jgi:isopenicillin-N N-acyltransferase-like protein|nr:C45 family autoproteolytic acyltransferase/hydrolase [Chloroflexota bacterium]
MSASASQTTDPTLRPPAGRLPLVRVAGSHGEMGLQLGRDRAQQVHSMIEMYQRLFVEARAELGIANWDEAILHAHKYLPFAEESTPQYVDEMRGIAEGAGVKFDDVLVLNCMEAITSDALHLGCTSLAMGPEVTATGSVLIGHNEDWIPEDIVNVFIVHARPEKEPAYLAITYGGMLPNIGFNAYGIAQCCDSVYPGDARVGVPRILVSRGVLAARTLSEAIWAACNRRRDGGYNHLIAHESGEIYNVEVSARTFEMLHSDDGMEAHANHYLHPRMQAIEKARGDLVNSSVRMNRARRLMAAQRGTADRLTIQAILADHVNFPQSICNHIVADDTPLDRQQTIASLVIDLSARTMHVCWGTPCCNEYFAYTLEP